MTNEQRQQKLAGVMRGILERKKALNEVGLRQIDSIARSLASASLGYFYIFPKDSERTASMLAERWFRLSHDTKNPRSFLGGRKRHSFYSFSQWVDSHYYVIAVPRGKWSKLAVKLLNLLLRHNI